MMSVADYADASSIAAAARQPHCWQQARRGVGVAGARQSRNEEICTIIRYSMPACRIIDKWISR